MYQPPPTKGDILIVDDTPDNLRFLSSILREQGYEVRGVTSGSAALMGVQAQPPDLILSDVVMPTMDGYELCRNLKAIPELQDIPIIFISALNETFDKVRAFAEGGVDYITKPFHIEEVLARIENQLQLRQLQVELVEALEREQALNQRIKEMAVWEERTRIARDIHDSLGHSLVALNIQLESALALWSDRPEEVHTLITEAKQQGTEALQAVRQSVANLRSDATISAQVLEDEVQKLAAEFHRTTGIEPTYDIQVSRLIKSQIHTTIYRIVQEGLTNICKYAEATDIAIEIRQMASQWTLVIRDNGKGFEVEQATQGFGLLGMKERIEKLGGSLEITSQPGMGCRIFATFSA